MVQQSRDWRAFFDKHLLHGGAVKKFSDDPIQSVLMPWFNILEVVSAEQLTDKTGKLTVRFPVQHEYLNPGGTLQGGLQTAMYDVVSSWVFIFDPEWASTGTSRSLDVTYLRPAPEGEMLLMECELVHAGRSLGLSTGVLKREKDGALISSCVHNKVKIDRKAAL